MKELKTRALAAAERYLEHRGYALIESSPTLPVDNLTDIVANDGNAIVFIEVLAKDNADTGFPEELDSERIREAKEMAAIRWLERQGGRYCDMAIRFDVVSLVVLAPDRALIRHHINAMTESALVPDLPFEPARPTKEVPRLACATA